MFRHFRDYFLCCSDPGFGDVRLEAARVGPCCGGECRGCRGWGGRDVWLVGGMLVEWGGGHVRTWLLWYSVLEHSFLVSLGFVFLDIFLRCPTMGVGDSNVGIRTLKL